jgi:GATA zinc finger
VCKNCGTDCTPFWRKDKHDQQPLCNACGLYAAKNGSMRPASLWKQDAADAGMGGGAAGAPAGHGAPALGQAMGAQMWSPHGAPMHACTVPHAYSPHGAMFPGMAMAAQGMPGKPGMPGMPPLHAPGQTAPVSAGHDAPPAATDLSMHSMERLARGSGAPQTMAAAARPLYPGMDGLAVAAQQGARRHLPQHEHGSAGHASALHGGMLPGSMGPYRRPRGAGGESTLPPLPPLPPMPPAGAAAPPPNGSLPPGSGPSSARGASAPRACDLRERRKSRPGAGRGAVDLIKMEGRDEEEEEAEEEGALLIRPQMDFESDASEPAVKRGSGMTTRLQRQATSA